MDIVDMGMVDTMALTFDRTIFAVDPLLNAVMFTWRKKGRPKKLGLALTREPPLLPEGDAELEEAGDEEEEAQPSRGREQLRGVRGARVRGAGVRGGQLGRARVRGGQLGGTRVRGEEPGGVRVRGREAGGISNGSKQYLVLLLNVLWKHTTE